MYSGRVGLVILVWLSMLFFSFLSFPRNIIHYRIQIEVSNFIKSDMSFIRPFPLEVFNLILLNLPLKDLLNARLVSKSWNEESLRILRHSKFRITLKEFAGMENSLDRFLQFATAQPEPCVFILPIKIIFKFIRAPDQIEPKLTTLINFYGSSCVKSLTLVSSSELKEFYTHILKLFTSVSDGLETLKIITSWSSSERQDEIRELFAKHDNLHFPNLKKLSLISSCFRPNAYDETFWRGLIQKSPNLRDLEIEIPESDYASLQNSGWCWPFPLDEGWTRSSKIESMKITHIPHIMISGIAPQIYLPGVPLKKLELTLDRINFNELSPANGILCIFASSLESLILVCNSSYATLSKSDLNPNMIFPRLIEFKIRILQKPTFSVNPFLFPALGTIEIPYDLNLITILGGSWFSLEFQSVKNLCLNVKPGVISTCIKDSLNYLLQHFPNLNKISIINDMIVAGENQGSSGMMKHVIGGIAESDKAANITEIELVDCYRNYLTEIFNSNSKPTRLILENFEREGHSTDSTLFTCLTQFVGETNLEISAEKRQNKVGKMSTCLIVQEKKKNLAEFKMTNLKKIKLNISEMSRRTIAAQHSGSKYNEFNLLAMTSCFPSLEEIQVSPYIFGSVGQVSAKIIQDVYSQIPNIKIKII